MNYNIRYLITELRSENLKLRILKSEHVLKTLDYLKRNEEFFKPWLPAVDEDFFTEEFQKKKMEYEYENIENGSMVKYWLFHKDDVNNENIIGDLTYSYIIRGVFWSCFLGYKIDKEMNGKGYATEAIKKANEYIFNDLKLHRIEANIIPRNIASIKVVEKCGFRQEGLAEKYLKINNVWEDHYHYVLLNPLVE